MSGRPICPYETDKIIKIEVIEIKSCFPFGDVSREPQEGLRVVASCSYETDYRLLKKCQIVLPKFYVLGDGNLPKGNCLQTNG